MNGFLLFLCHVSDECCRLLPICDTVECLIYCLVSEVSYVTGHAGAEEVSGGTATIRHNKQTRNGTSTRVRVCNTSTDLLQLECCLWELHLGRSSVIDEPINLTGIGKFDPGCGEPAFF